MLINVLIIFFILYIFYQVFLYNINKSPIIEGMGAEEITSYNKNDPDNAMILAQENAGNIQVIKKQLEKLLDLDKQVNTMNNDLDKLAVQVNGIIMN